MAIPHAKPSQVIDVRPLGSELTDAQTTTLIKSDTLEVIRLVLPAGKNIARHEVRGEIVLQCLEGKVDFQVGTAHRELSAGQMLYLEGASEHGLRAIENSSLLLTILLQSESS